MSSKVCFVFEISTSTRKKFLHGPRSTYQKPKEITYFSFDENRKLLLKSDNALNYYFPPPAHSLSTDSASIHHTDRSTIATSATETYDHVLDLNHGYPDNYISRDVTIPEHLDALIEALKDYNLSMKKQHLELQQQQWGRDEKMELFQVKPNFITWRGMLTKMLCTPYSNEEWRMNLTLHEGTIYIEENLELKLQSANYQLEQNNKFVYYGYKFESICTSPYPPPSLEPFSHSHSAQNKVNLDEVSSSPSTEPHCIKNDQESMSKQQLDPGWIERYNSKVNTNVQFCSVFKTKLGYHSFILGGEVDCLYSDKDIKDHPNRQNYYAELKTNRVITNYGQKMNFYKNKMLRVWAQSFLAGVPTILFGYRDDQGILKKIEKVNTSDIPRMARTFHESHSQHRNAYSRTNPKEPLWDPTLCLNFTDQLLTWIKGKVTVDDRTVTYRLSFKPKRGQVELEGPFYNANVFVP